MSEENLKYSETHEWARLDGDFVVVGLSAFAIEQLGDVVYLELPNPGDNVSQGASFGLVESVKAASDIYAPVDGSVAEVNYDVADNLDLLKTDPYGAAWLIKIEPGDPSQLESLMGGDEYEKFCASQVDE
ncbi:MAG: glycine cleavage system protein GcvH [Sedimentisphaerales bacterium]|nr:glycine cleavage system protein GcvH [Sedimentisphaerales bacterium]